jgi:uncharacterized GH25 family protein
MTVTDGAVIRGRLVKDGKPVVNAEIGLATHSRMAGEPLPEMRVGTGENGTFAITNVPTGRLPQEQNVEVVVNCDVTDFVIRL